LIPRKNLSFYIKKVLLGFAKKDRTVADEYHEDLEEIEK
jgi:hypothetical protein